MWPKAFAQLIELAPHVSRLLPMADRFFQTKSTTEDANRKAIEAMADKVHGHLGQIVETHTGFSRQISELSGQAAVAAGDARAAKMAADRAEARLIRMEETVRALRVWLAGLLFGVVLILALLAVLLLRKH